MGLNGEYACMLTDTLVSACGLLDSSTNLFNCPVKITVFASVVYKLVGLLKLVLYLALLLSLKPAIYPSKCLFVPPFVSGVDPMQVVAAPPICPYQVPVPPHVS